MRDRIDCAPLGNALPEERQALFGEERRGEERRGEERNAFESAVINECLSRLDHAQQVDPSLGVLVLDDGVHAIARDERRSAGLGIAQRGG